MVLHLLTVLFALLVTSHAARSRGPDVYTLCKRGFSYTWDDGPWTMHEEIVETFDTQGAKTSFYINGNNWSCIYDEENVQTLRTTFENGHQIASHTYLQWSHASLTELNDTQIDYEIKRLDEALIKILGIRPRFFRPPYGNFNQHIIDYIRGKHNKTIIMWSNDSGDATGGSARDSWNFYTRFAREEPDYTGLTLSHEVSDAGVEAMRNGTVQALVEAGVELLTTADCLGLEPYDYVGDYGERDETWNCDAEWTPSVSSR
ncbi:carbohydrate esterase family 4 protein [Serendipita vermifera MAFF 305830]|uniref:Carbohydrate esterase family 4 protein n=1 Tax=Serendipita vermifera MAFF 305830 TaxID=933852 RepID=A0A0C3B4A8_SERVB|nr:carbohydrate esterase family 4 protein [Serendipita vermifera MAFF 305830]